MKLTLTDNQPLADRIRPKSMDEFVGQEHLMERLRAFLASKRLPSLLFFGPPGCGKSTMAMLLAKETGKAHVRVSAPESGLTALRKQLPGLAILVLDELHRFSKAQQDFFLPLLESGQIVLLATTTENPSFSVTNQLLSRLHVLRFRPLSREELVTVGKRGAAELGLELSEDSLQLLAAMSSGDARAMLNLLEYTAELPEERRAPEPLAQALPEVVLRGDRDGDNHYELASALIKSIRGSDPDAAIYYLACLLEAGEDPRFVARRLVISASEDIGLGDPNALGVAVAGQQAVEFVGMPEGAINLAEVAIYLALAPKSNTTYAALRAAQKEIRENGPASVPLHLRNASTALQREWGYGRGYKYPHAFPGSWVEQDYLPEQVKGRKFFATKEEGEEPRLYAWLKSRLRKHRP